MTNDGTSVAGLFADHMRNRLVAYREYVARAAGGEQLPGAAFEEIDKLMRHIGLPDYAWRRDVRAWAGSDSARGYRRMELTLNHPHLFDEPAVWVRDRIARAARRQTCGR
jgi:hypothetical protein